MKKTFIFIVFIIPFTACKKEQSSIVSDVSGETQQEQMSCGDSPSNFAVLELFTSQGCFYCPSADDLLKQLVEKEELSGRNVIAIAEHIIYWDAGGWKDTYGQKSLDDRQLLYYSKLKLTYSYTPQVFINGKYEGNGNDEPFITKTIDECYNKTAPASVCLKLLSKQGDSLINIGYEVKGAKNNNLLYISILESDLTSQPNKGENKGKTLHHTNVARVFQSINLSVNQDSVISGEVALVPPSDLNFSNSSIVGFVQDSNTMEILAGTKGFDL